MFRLELNDDDQNDNHNFFSLNKFIVLLCSSDTSIMHSLHMISSCTSHDEHSWGTSSSASASDIWFSFCSVVTLLLWNTTAGCTAAAVSGWIGSAWFKVNLNCDCNQYSSLVQIQWNYRCVIIEIWKTGILIIFIIILQFVDSLQCYSGCMVLFSIL